MGETQICWEILQICPQTLEHSEKREGNLGSKCIIGLVGMDTLDGYHTVKFDSSQTCISVIHYEESAITVIT